MTTASVLTDQSFVTNTFGIAIDKEIDQNQYAVQILKELDQSQITIAQIDIHFKHPNKPVQMILIIECIKNTLANIFCLHTNIIIPFKKRSQRICDGIKKKYNRDLNKLKLKLLKSSPLSNLLFINNNLKYLTKREPNIRKRLDFVDPFGSSVGTERFILHTNGPEQISGSNTQLGGGRTQFNTSEECLSAMRACLENCVDWSSICTTMIEKQSSLLFGCIMPILIHPYTYALIIRFTGTNYWIKSDDPRLLHILCNGNPPKINNSLGNFFDSNLKISSETTHKTLNILYPQYGEFMRLVENQFKQIVRNSVNNILCPIGHIYCCRREPVCQGYSYFQKSILQRTSLIHCQLCNMDLCARGCGKIHHGNSPCTASLDEASEFLIQESSKPCPRCNVQITKSEGCNHMTCQCSCQFCWLCGIEMPRDEITINYRTDLHYGIEGQGINGGCIQFS